MMALGGQAMAASKPDSPYLLLTVFVGNGPSQVPAVAQIPMQTKDACERAMNVIKETHWSVYDTTTVCLSTGMPQ